MLQVASPAWAQEPSRTPSPKELWEAYPLEPDQAPATVTATPSASAAPVVLYQADSGGVSPAVPIGLAALLALGVGAGLGLYRRRGRTAVEPAEPPAPKRFQWRDYPPPARPAPPPPPVPGARGPSFEAALEDERAAAPARSAQREPH